MAGGPRDDGGGAGFSGGPTGADAEGRTGEKKKGKGGPGRQGGPKQGGGGQGPQILERGGRGREKGGFPGAWEGALRGGGEKGGERGGVEGGGEVGTGEIFSFHLVRKIFLGGNLFGIDSN